MSADGVEPTASNRGPLLNIATWLVLVLMCIPALAKLGAKWGLIRNLQYDDAFTILAMFCSIGYAVAATLQVANGAGRHHPEGPPHGYLKAAYGSEILYSFSLCFAKMIILQMLLLLSRNHTRKRPVQAVIVFNIAWGLASVFAIAFQCSPQRVWDTTSATCFNQGHFWLAFAVLDVFVDTSIGSLAMLLFYDLNMSWKVKLPIISAFGARISLIPIIILRFLYVNTSLKSQDYVFDSFYASLLTSVHVNFSVIMSCIPFLKPVINGIQSGILAGHIQSLAPTDASTYVFTASRRGKSKFSSHELLGSKPPVLPVPKLLTRWSDEQIIMNQSREVSEEQMVESREIMEEEVHTH